MKGSVAEIVVADNALEARIVKAIKIIEFWIVFCFLVIRSEDSSHAFELPIATGTTTTRVNRCLQVLVFSS